MHTQKVSKKTLSPLSPFSKECPLLDQQKEDIGLKKQEIQQRRAIEGITSHLLVTARIVQE